MEKNLHIICLDVPYPPDYGGVFDLFYKLPALQAQGVRIHLHCFDYGRGPQEELNRYCVSVNYYPRQEGHKGISASLPYIVCSRRSEELFQNLLKDDFPILMEGVHCTFLLLDPRFDNRKKYVRIHNVEFRYYRELQHCTRHPLKKLYFAHESALLRKHEQAIAGKATAFWGVTQKDVLSYREQLGCRRIEYLPLYLPAWKVTAPTGMGTFCLYHGNLGIAENEKAATWLIKNIFAKSALPLVIAGKNPSRKLIQLAHSRSNICMVENPSEKVMSDMISKAHIHVLPSFNTTGIKIKLLNALYNGRHCVVNPAMVEGTGLESCCHISNSVSAMQNLLEQLYHQPFTSQELAFRQEFLSNHFNNERNARQQVQWIWGD